MVTAVIVIIFAAALGEAFYHQLLDVGIKTTTGHIQVYPKGWDFDILSPMSGDIPRLQNNRRLKEIISNAPFFKAQGREIIYQILLYDKTDNYYYAALAGVEPENVSKTLPGLKLLKGTNISEGIEKGILISQDMADYFNTPFLVNDKMYIIIGGTNGMMEGAKTNFYGVVKSMPFFADRLAFTNISKLQKLIGWDTDECSTIKIFLEDKDKVDICVKWLKQEFNLENFDLEVKTWRELGGFYYHIALLGRVLVSILLLILAAITAISVSNTMLMSVKERTKEIGTIMAMGFKQTDVIKVFIIESFSLSVISTSIGMVMGLIITNWFQHRGIIKGVDLVLEGQLYPIPEMVPVVFSFLWILFIGTLAGLYPAYRASNLNPIDALRHT